MSLDMDVLYRAGETLQGILTYTPRLVSINSQGSLGSMSSCGSLYYEIPSMDPSHVTTWHGSVSKNVSEPFKKNLFLQSLYKDSDEPTTSTNDGTEDKDQELVECLQNGVNFWTDFSKLHYHPKSLYELSGISSGAQECDNYGTGKDVFSEGSCGEEMNDRLRFFVEECGNIQSGYVLEDNLKFRRFSWRWLLPSPDDSSGRVLFVNLQLDSPGIQFIVDDSGIFSSVATDFLENIADDFTKTPVLLYSAKGELSTFLSIEDAKQFHSSAVYAAALHSTSLPFRMRTSGPCINSRYATGAMNIDGLVSMLAGQGRQNMVATLDIAMPAPPLIGAQKQRSFLRSLHSLTPDITKDVEDMHALESINVHGVLHSDCTFAISKALD
ncbi:hypothetical protein GIB67_029618 [Kingdonia uniflora]|uniref:Uncharacterized protein n=1 Tax=Kingdonia uniflora TaxID=39325 RepID=A0A7J7LLK3_9MAGN|nr:hypothetical protein GIB67_029618 [Kingdonia uniflora]